MPLPVAIALPVLFPEHFVADGARGDWIEQFGFIRSDGGGEPTTGLEAKRLGLLRLVSSVGTVFQLLDHVSVLINNHPNNS